MAGSVSKPCEGAVSAECSVRVTKCDGVCRQGKEQQLIQPFTLLGASMQAMGGGHRRDVGIPAAHLKEKLSVARLGGLQPMTRSPALQPAYV